MIEEVFMKKRREGNYGMKWGRCLTAEAFRAGFS